MRATSTAAMEILLCLPPLHLIVKRETLVSVNSTLTNDRIGINQRKIAEENRWERQLRHTYNKYH